MSHHFPDMLAIRQRKIIAQYTSSNLVCIIDSGPDWLNQVPELQTNYIFPISLSTSGYEALSISVPVIYPTSKVIVVVLVSLLLTLNIFHTFF